MHALRGGTVAGEHEVCFFGPMERIRLSHEVFLVPGRVPAALVAEYRAALKKAGIESVIAEVQKQVDDFLAKN